MILDSLKTVLWHSVFKKHTRNIRKKKKKKKRNISFWLSKHPIYRNRQRKKKEVCFKGFTLALICFYRCNKLNFVFDIIQYCAQ